MVAYENFLSAVQYISNISRIRTAAQELISKGVTVDQIESAILSDGIPVLPEVHAILVELERNIEERSIS